MGRTVAIAAILFLWSRFAVADLPIPEAAKDATDRYQTAITNLTREHSSAIIEAKQQHARELDPLIAKAKAAGELDAVLKLTEEKDKVTRSNAIVGGQAPAAAGSARRAYDQAVRKAESNFNKTAQMLQDAFLKELAELEKTETKSDRIASAQEVRAFSLDRKRLGPAKFVVNENVQTDSAAGEWVDLLEWAQGMDWGHRGINWNQFLDGPVTKQGLKLKHVEGSALGGSRFPLPAVVDGDYELEVEFTRHAGDDVVGIVFPLGNHNMVLELSAGHGGHGGVLFIEGRRWENNPTLRSPFPVENQKRHRIVVRTHLDADTAEFSIDWDEVKNFITWKGPSAALTNVEDQFWNLSMIRHPWLVAGVGNVTFENARIRMRNGTIRRDSITDADRQQDLKSGFVRLVGQPVSSMRVGDWTPVLVNQMPPLLMVRGDVERTWPLITRGFAICKDYYGAHAPSRVVCDIPVGAKCFTAIGYNDTSRTTRYLVSIDGKSVFDSGITGIAIAKVDIPAKASQLELVIDPAGDQGVDHSYWCYPRFHSTASDRINDKMLDGKTGTLKFQVKSSTVGYGTLTRNQPISLSIPIHFRDALPCDEFLWAHAPSAVTYSVPNGMNRFTAIGYCAQSRHVKFEVWADQKLLYESPQAGIIPIDTKLPPGTSKLELKINNLGDSSGDRSMWCYPRLHRK